MSLDLPGHESLAYCQTNTPGREFVSITLVPIRPTVPSSLSHSLSFIKALACLVLGVGSEHHILWTGEHAYLATFVFQTVAGTC